MYVLSVHYNYMHAPCLQAVLGGQWVVLEDIDCAPSDVVSRLWL